METVRLRPLCYALGFNATRPEQWISRGYFKPSQEGVPGRPRELTKKDAVTLLALADLADAGFDAAKVYRELRYLWRLKSTTYLVISTGYLGRLIPTSERGQPAPSDDECVPVYMPGHLYSEIVPAEDLYKTLGDPQRHVSIVLSLDRLLARVDQAWSSIANSDEG